MHQDSSLILEKAKRLKSVRALIGLSRKQIEDIYGISENTLRLWESPATNSKGLSEKGAIRIIDMLKKTGIVCTIEWLLHGRGDGPKSYKDLQSKVISSIENFINIPEVIWDDEIVLREVEAFRDLNPDPIAIRINDDSMEPLLCSGDYVAGNRRFGNDIEKYIGLICIIETADCQQLCRRLDKDINNRYILLAINPHTRASQPVIYNAKCHSVAQVVWIRKKEIII